MNFKTVFLPLFIAFSWLNIAYAEHHTAYISIIIDDVGYNRKTAQQLIELPQALTFAILPDSPYARHTAEQAHKRDKEVMLHLPMESDKHSAHEPETLTLDMETQQFKTAFYNSLDKVPYISGINNHMGSKLTRSADTMDWLMSEMAKTSFYFIDSRTTKETLAASTAKQYQIPVLSRDIFIDNNRDADKIEKQLDKLKRLAKSNYTALAIGHPYPETYEALSRFLTGLHEENIVLIPVSRLIQISNIFNNSDLLAQGAPN